MFSVENCVSLEILTARPTLVFFHPNLDLIYKLFDSRVYIGLGCVGTLPSSLLTALRCSSVRIEKLNFAVSYIVITARFALYLVTDTNHGDIGIECYGFFLNPRIAVPTNFHRIRGEWPKNGIFLLISDSGIRVKNHRRIPSSTKS